MSLRAAIDSQLKYEAACRKQRAYDDPDTLMTKRDPLKVGTLERLRAEWSEIEAAYGPAFQVFPIDVRGWQ